MELSLAKKDPKEMILLKQSDRKAYVIMVIMKMLIKKFMVSLWIK